MITKWSGESWDRAEVTQYKNEPGTWMDVSRTVLFDSKASKFQTRYFELSPGGYSSYEQHQHEHCVVVLRGSGRVRLGEVWSEIGPNDVIHVAPGVPHQFEAPLETMGILCIVDRDRDPAVPIQNLPPAETSNVC